MTTQTLTPRTDAVCITPIMAEACTPHKWDTLQALSRQLERELAEAKVKWHDAANDPPDDEQTVLGCWHGPSCTESMETLVYRAAEPNDPACWFDVFGQKIDAPTHWTILEMPK